MDEMVLKITQDNFDAEVMQSDIPVLVDFWAEWCGPCRMMSPIVDKLAEELGGKLKVGKLNVDEEGELAAQYGVMSIPTLLLFKNGEVAETMIGARPAGQLKALAEKHI